MAQLLPVKCGWKWLEKTINTLIAAINQNTPTGGAGIHTAPSPSGTAISLEIKTKTTDVLQPALDPSVDGSGGSGGSGGTTPADPGGTGYAQLLSSPDGAASWILMNVPYDDGTGNFMMKQLYVWGSPPR